VNIGISAAFLSLQAVPKINQSSKVIMVRITSAYATSY